MTPCVLCAARPETTGRGYCETCHWIVQAELCDGWSQLGAYLASWAAFDAWCAGPLIREGVKA